MMGGGTGIGGNKISKRDEAALKRAFARPPTDYKKLAQDTVNDLKSLRDFPKFDPNKKPQYIKFKGGRYKVFVYPNKSLEQLASAEDALKKGYLPTDPSPNILFIGKGKLVESQKTHGYYFTHLFLNVKDIPKDAEAYVGSGKSHTVSSGRILAVAMQFYRKK